MELANQATFTDLELEAYRKVMDEIQQAREYGEAKRAEGRTEGRAEGELKGKRDTLLRLLARAGIEPDDGALARIHECMSLDTLDKWIDNVFGARTITDVLA